MNGGTVNTFTCKLRGTVHLSIALATARKLSWNRSVSLSAHVVRATGRRPRCHSREVWHPAGIYTSYPILLSHLDLSSRHPSFSSLSETTYQDWGTVIVMGMMRGVWGSSWVGFTNMLNPNGWKRLEKAESSIRVFHPYRTLPEPLKVPALHPTISFPPAPALGYIGSAHGRGCGVMWRSKSEEISFRRPELLAPSLGYTNPSVRT